MQLSQINLVLAITKEIERQAKKSKQSTSVSPRHFNAITKAADRIILEFTRPEVPSRPAMGLQEWLRSDDTGTSSLTMAAVFFNAGKYAFNSSRWCHPLDPADFGRCHRFLDAVPGARDLLPNMAKVSPVWKALIDHWEELTALYIEERPRNEAPKLYARMQELIETARPK